MQRGQARAGAVPSVQSWLRAAYMPNRLVDPLTSARPKAEIVALGSLSHQHTHVILTTVLADMSECFQSSGYGSNTPEAVIGALDGLSSKKEMSAFTSET